MAKRIFINYRREDTQRDADALYDFLEKKVGRKRLFMDIDSILPGEDFTQTISDTIEQTDVVLMLIGPKWEESIRERAKSGQSDYVLQEIDQALQSGVRVIPVLFYRDTLPDYESLKDVPYGSRLPNLNTVNSLPINRNFRKAGYERLVEAIQSTGKDKTAKRPKAKRIAGISALVLLVALVLFFKPWNFFFARGEREAWEAAKQEDRMAAYMAYTKRFPSGKYEEEAEQAIAQFRAEYNVPETEYVEGGAFEMGNTGPKAEEDEQPVHEVAVEGFYMGKYEVTVDEFETFVNAAGYETTAERNGWSYVLHNGSWRKGSNVHWKHDISGNARPEDEYVHPVIHVSWEDATMYCAWLREVTGLEYHLPTEAQWEYAAGGGMNERQLYAGTDDEKMLKKYAWYSFNSSQRTHPGDTRKPNSLGLHNMSGNVWEWCRDVYSADYYQRSPSTNPEGPEGGSSHVIRGGSWSYGAKECRVTEREHYTPNSRYNDVGFRIVRLE